MATKPFDAHKAVILERILRTWEKCSRLTLGELIDASCAFSDKNLSTLNDQDFCDVLERFALLGTESLDALIPEPITITRHISDQIRAMCYHRILRADCATCKSKSEG